MAQTGFDDPKFKTKRWLRSVLMPAIQFWAPVLKLESHVDQITLFIAEPEDEDIGNGCGARIVVDSSRRTADVRIKRNVIELMQGEYVDAEYSPEEVAELTLLHELVHILTHAMSAWASTAIDTMRNKITLEGLFSTEEEKTVEHLTRVFFSQKQSLSSEKKFHGVIRYITADPRGKRSE